MLRPIAISKEDTIESVRLLLMGLRFLDTEILVLGQGCLLWKGNLFCSGV